MSEAAKVVLDALPVTGNRCNFSTLEKRLGMPLEAIERAAVELVDAECAVVDGKRLSRAASAQVATGDRPLSKEAKQLLDELPNDGSR
ncbi:MAG: hypothetical protein M3481_12160, partial [Actinomycetota bacterium]|nr:hypothetical protein [Actinomycetota bacterium]